MKQQRTKLVNLAMAASLILSATVYSTSSSAENGQELSEPEVIIKQSGNEKISEYYVNGILVEIKVEPKNAPTYYLVPAEGGQMLRTDESQLLVPSWKILEW